MGTVSLVVYSYRLSTDLGEFLAFLKPCSCPLRRDLCLVLTADKMKATINKTRTVFQKGISFGKQGLAFTYLSSIYFLVMMPLGIIYRYFLDALEMKNTKRKSGWRECHISLDSIDDLRRQG